MTTKVHEHGAAKLCEAGLSLYDRALREGGIPAEDSAHVPCLLDFGLLRPDSENPRWLLPLTPALALPRLLHESAQDIARQRRQEARLAEGSNRSWLSTGPPGRQRTSGASAC